MNEEYYQPNPTLDNASINQAVSQSNMMATQTNQMQYQMDDMDKTFAQEQLDCNRTLTDIYHDLMQDVQKPNPDKEGLTDWYPMTDETKRIFTDDGVQKIMQIMKGYINKETLLSNFDDKQIKRRMMEFNLAFSGLIFMKYEVIFRQPSMTECEDILNRRIEQRVEKQMAISRILRTNVTRNDIRNQVINEIREHIDNEIDKIRNVKKNENLREFESLFYRMSHLVESTHGRAWKGEERGSLRRRTSVNEVIGGASPQPQKKSMWGFK